MDGHADVGRERAHFDGQHAFGNQLARARAHDTDTEYAFRLRIDEQLGETFGPVAGDGASRGGPRKLGNGDLASLFFGLRFGEAGPSNFRIGEDDGGNRVRFEGDFVAGDGFDGGAAFVHGFVGQHRFAGDVADRVDGGVGGLALLVDFDESLLVDFHFRFVEAGDLGIRTASYRHQHTVEYLLCFFYVWTFKSYADTGLFVLERFDGGVQLDRGEEFFQALVEREHEVAIGSGEQAGHHFYASHFGAERGVDRAQF